MMCMTRTNRRTPEERLNAIVEQGLCIGCGLCQAVAGDKNIAVAKCKSGYEHPVVIGELSHDTVDKIYATCPGTQIEGLPESQISDDAKRDNVWGIWHRMVLAYAGDEQTRHRGATGGVLTALANYLLASKKVDFILHVKASPSHPTFGESHLSFTHADVMEGAGSRYGPTAPLLAIDKALDRNQSFAFIGKPCDINALRNYAKYDKRVDLWVKYFLTLVCGGYLPPQKMDEFLEEHDIKSGDVTKVRYRGFGCPGSTRIETKNQVKEFNYLDFWGEDAAQWSLPFRCKVCPDGIGEAADIVASDTWPGGSPNRADSETDKGTNAIIARTERGAKLIADAIADGALAIEYDIPPDMLSLYQPHQVAKKYAVWGRYQGLKQQGRIVPQTARLRIEELAGELPETHSDFQREGTVKRVRQGKIDQPAPELIK